MNQAEYEEMMAKAKEKYRDGEKRKIADKANRMHRRWYKQNADYKRFRSREWRKEQYQKNKEKFLQIYKDMPFYTCPRCNRKMKSKFQHNHDTYSKCGIAENGAPEPWQCPVCLVLMNPNNRWQHRSRTPCAEGFKVIEENIILSNINEDNEPTDESIGEQTGQGGD